MMKGKLKAASYLLCLIVLCHETLVLCQDKKEEESAETQTPSIYNGCNQTINEGQGIILSPGFPSPYSANLFCTWNIEVEPTRTVLISFRVFDVESSSSCMYDKVKIYNGPTTNHMLMGKHCGVFRPGDTVGTSNRMLMTFESDGNNVHPKSGFYAVFVSVPQRLAVPGSCGGVLREPKGEFHSLNFPKSNYPNQVTCTWYIRSDADKVIILSFQKFTLEVSKDCRYDSVTVMSGSSNGESTRILGKYCRTSDIPDQIISDGNEMYVTFSADSSGNEVGFLAYYNTEYADLHKKTPDKEVEPEKEVSSTGATTAATTPKTAKMTTTTTTPKTPPPKTKPFIKPKPSATSVPVITTTATTTPATTLDPNIPDCSGPCADQSDISSSCISEYGILAKLVEIRSISSFQMELGLTVMKTMKLKSLKKLKMPSKKSVISVTVTCPSCFGNFDKGSKYMFSGKAVNIIDKKTVKSPHFAQPYNKQLFKKLKKAMKSCSRSSKKSRRHAKRRRGKKNIRA